MLELSQSGRRARTGEPTMLAAARAVHRVPSSRCGMNSNMTTREHTIVLIHSRIPAIDSENGW